MNFNYYNFFLFFFFFLKTAVAINPYSENDLITEKSCPAYLLFQSDYWEEQKEKNISSLFVASFILVP